ncbi:interleukin 23 receptor [Rhinolophus ferrumequinum]|uniref:Interleukin 23 receptor n=1 Tax=Rhinolophus ferrumequinum TaxID=59479 RepID=A0A7J7X4W5_RHIFE|nr:interleukin 23 receptor [Rhinolophus ferrumequinum]
MGCSNSSLYILQLVSWRNYKYKLLWPHLGRTSHNFYDGYEYLYILPSSN